MRTSSLSSPVHPAVQQELQFRLSLLRLLTVPHRPVPGESLGSIGGEEVASRQIEELTALVPVRRTA
jgi:hypothetical protein